MQYEHREYIGTIVPPFDLERKRVTKNGWYLDFMVQLKDGKTQQCRLWEEVYEAAASVFEVGKKVALFGHLAGEQLRVRTARDVAAPEVRPVEPLNKTAFAQKRAAMNARGFVPVRSETGIAWYPKTDVIRIAGRNLLKIDWVVEKLGGTYVADKLKAERFVELAGGHLNVKGSLRQNYLKLLDELVKEAKAADAEEF